jgi:predicted alpha-1,2-mannosidase
MGETAEAARFITRALDYRHVFHPHTGFFHPRTRNGSWVQPFNYTNSGGNGARDYYDENNGWTYRWNVQQFPQDLLFLIGNTPGSLPALDDLFTTPLDCSRQQLYHQFPDQTANVGQFTMANEPSMHIPWFYNIALCPWHTQKMTRTLLHTWFRNDILGVPGDEDGGGESGFVVFSSMGLYPFTPGIPYYLIGSPVFSDVKINVGRGKTFHIVAHNAGEHNKYVQSAKLNGRSYNKCWITHEQVLNGAELVLEMGEKANTQWGIEERPPMATEPTSRY